MAIGNFSISILEEGGGQSLMLAVLRKERGVDGIGMVLIPIFADEFLIAVPIRIALIKREWYLEKNRTEYNAQESRSGMTREMGSRAIGAKSIRRSTVAKSDPWQKIQNHPSKNGSFIFCVVLTDHFTLGSLTT